MATKNIEPNQTAVEAEYSVKELSENSVAVFGQNTSPDCVTAALRVAGVKQTTKSEAIKIVQKFMNKEVK